MLTFRSCHFNYSFQATVETTIPDGRRIQSSPMVAMDRRKELLAGLDISLLALEVAYSKGAKVAGRLISDNKHRT